MLVAVVFASCSEDQVEPINTSAGSSLSVLKEGLLSYKDNSSFIKEYSALSELKSKKEIQKWVASKGLKSLLDSSEAVDTFQDSLIDNTQVIYSDALKAILNEDSKFMIGEKIIWLNGRNFYQLDKEDSDKKLSELLTIKKNLVVYGSLLNNQVLKSNLNSRTIPNENRSKDWVKYFDNSNRRLVLVLTNETIKYSNGEIVSSKMFLYCAEQYKSCSFWRCTWKTNTNTTNTLNFSNFSTFILGWNINQPNGTFQFSNGSTILMATSNDYSSNYTNSGLVNTSVAYQSFGYSWSQLINWY